MRREAAPSTWRRTSGPAPRPFPSSLILISASDEGGQSLNSRIAGAQLRTAATKIQALCGAWPNAQRDSRRGREEAGVKEGGGHRAR
jgi:hypothetical protein